MVLGSALTDISWRVADGVLREGGRDGRRKNYQRDISALAVLASRSEIK